MIKKIKQWGHSVVITLNREELEYFNARVGGYLNISDAFAVDPEKDKKKDED